MSRQQDKKQVYIVSPIYGDDFGNKKIIGYENLRNEYLICVPATSELDVTIYGDRLNKVLKFSNSNPIDINEKGGDGIFFNIPEQDENGYYQNPEYISKPLLHFGKVWQFDAELNE